MDTLIALSIVAATAVWFAARLIRRLWTKPNTSCTPVCGGCDLAPRSAGQGVRGDHSTSVAPAARH